jgi:hypothetical protein
MSSDSLPSMKSEITVGLAPVLPIDVKPKVNLEDKFREHLRRVYLLYYHYGTVPWVIKGFFFDGPMKDAIIRAREHCLRMGIRFIKIRPLVVDLEEQERRKEQGEYEENFTE